MNELPFKVRFGEFELKGTVGKPPASSRSAAAPIPVVTANSIFHKSGLFLYPGSVTVIRPTVITLWLSGFRYSKAGIITQDLVPPPIPQRALFDNLDHEKAAKVIGCHGRGEPALGSGDRGACCNDVQRNLDADVYNEVRDALAAVYDAVGRAAGDSVILPSSHRSF